MDLSTLTKTPGSRKPRKRVGRGMASGHGKTSGRGHKGQMARKGHKIKTGFEGGQMPLLRRLPKRGFKNPTRVAFEGVNMGSLSIFDNGAEVTPDSLQKNGLVSRGQVRVKILGGGTCTKKLNVKAHAFSASAKVKIEAVGGTCVTL